MERRRWFGIVMRESTDDFSWATPRSACSILALASKAKGFVVMATVRAPNSLDISAITGEAPVPVPPPSPQVIKTMSVPAR